MERRAKRRENIVIQYNFKENAMGEGTTWAEEQGARPCFSRSKRAGSIHTAAGLCREDALRYFV